MSNLRETTADQTGSTESKRLEVACLILVFQSEIPLPTARHWLLGDVSEVNIGRRLRSGRLVETGGGLHIELEDRHASERHARLQRAYGRWILQDQESRNGTFVDGVEIETCGLRDGAVIEIGRSFFVYRDSDPAGNAEFPDGMRTLNPSFSRELEALARIASTPHAVVLRGDTGTGKEVVAQAIHRMSKRSGPFQSINCAALPQSIAEAELFGHRKGAFSGAMEDRPGLIRAAHGGTLFLDEIGDLPLPMQGLLLRALQESEVTPVGSTKPVPVDFRLLSATHRNLEAMSATGDFRSDLLARLGGFTLKLPVLRERLEDLGMIVAALLRRSTGHVSEGTRFSLGAMRTLFRYPWPLNVRELEKAVSVAATLANLGRIELRHLPPALSAIAPLVPPPKVLPSDKQQRCVHLKALLQDHNGNISAVARSLRTSRMQVHRWMDSCQLDPDDFRG